MRDLNRPYRVLVGDAGARRFHPVERSGPTDLPRLMRHSKRLRAYVGMLRRSMNRAGAVKDAETFAQLCNDVRLDLRVAVDMPAGIREPSTEPDALAYMRAPNFVRSLHQAELLRYISRKGTDPRVLLTVERAIGEAAKLNIPLWPSALLVDEGERASAYVSGDVDILPAEWLHGTGRSVQLAHGTLRHLPWACWAVVDGIVERASAATGYPLRPVDPIPGEFELVEDCRPLDATDVRFTSRRLGRDEGRAEAEALFAFYTGKADAVPWETTVPEASPEPDDE